MPPSEHVFLDYGAGMGRVMVLAATYPFRRVLGVEVSAELSEIARANLEKCRSRLRCKDVEIITADATLYSPPSDVSVIYFYNPFAGEVLEAVFKNVQRLAANSRLLFLICNLPHSSGFEFQILRQGWLELKKDFPLPGIGKCLIFRAKPELRLGVDSPMRSVQQSSHANAHFHP